MLLLREPLCLRERKLMFCDNRVRSNLVKHFYWPYGTNLQNGVWKTQAINGLKQSVTQLLRWSRQSAMKRKLVLLVS